ncbi:MAG: hypothetical protein ACTSYA_04600 [Candidatus Kariarchaeaceae archaeon]
MSDSLIEERPQRLLIISIGITLIGTIVYLLFTGIIFFSAFDTFRKTSFYPFTSFLIMVIFLITLSYKTLKYEIYYSHFLIMFAIFGSIFFFLQTIEWSNALDNGLFNRGGNRLLALSDFFLVLISLTFYLHYDQINSGRLRGIGYAIVGAGIVPMLVISFGLVFANNTTDYQTMAKFLYNIFGLSVGIISIYAIYVASKMIYLSHNPKTVTPSIIQLIGTLWIFLNFALAAAFGDKELTLTIFGNEVPFRVFDVPHYAIGAMILLSAYSFYPRFIYTLPFEANELIIVNNMNGMPIYYHSLSERSSSNIEGSMLKSGAILGISSITKEVLGHDTSLELIKLKTKILRVSQVNDLLFCIIAQRSSRVLESSLIKFGDEFYKKYGMKLSDYTSDISIFAGAKELVMQYFPFAPER